MMHDQAHDSRSQRSARLAACVLIAWLTLWAGASPVRAADPAPSLDDLLNLKPAPGTNRTATTQPSPPAPSAAPPATGVPLDPSVARRLTGQEVNDLFLAAVREMGDAAEQLGRSMDVGLNAQRAQQSVLDKLDRLIASSRQSSSSSSSSSSDSSDSADSPGQQDKGNAGNASRNGQQPGEKSGDKPGDKPDKADKNGGDKNSDKPGDAARPGNDPNRGANRSPGGGGGGARDASPLEAVRKEWGNLPPRVRDELIQAQQEPVAPIYRDMTEEFYRRLAEEAK